MLLAPILLTALATVAGDQPTPATIALELRVFSGAEEVTAETRLTVYRAGERSQPVAQLPGAATVETNVPAGIYDVQAIREVDGNVVAIRWAERLVVMAYPDEGGRHLEVVNFSNGFGALQVRAKDPAQPPDVAIYAAGEREKEAAARLQGRGYALFVLPAGKYDVKVTGTAPAWHAGIDVPLGRTRLWIVP